MKRISIVVSFLLFLGCNGEADNKIFTLNNLLRWEPPDEHTSVNLLKSYPNKKKCLDNEINANVYITLVEQDTLIVFELCKRMPDYAKNDFKNKDDLDLIIEKRNISSDVVRNVFVSSELKLTGKRHYYVIASLTRLEY